MIDLHMHSWASDGSMSPGELVSYVASKGIKTMALTDHETIDGINEAKEASLEKNIKLIPGIEASVSFETEMHILAYFSETNYINIKPLADELKYGRGKRNEKMLKKLEELGIHLTIEEINAEAFNGVASRPHIAKVLMKKGYVKSIKEAFDRFLSNGAPAYIKRHEITPEEFIKTVNDIGGVPVLAHPILLGYGWKQLDELIGRLAYAGLKGMEVFYSENKGDDTGKLLRLAIKHDLITTGGSDYHGSFKPGLEPGIGRGNLKIPDKCLEDLLRLLNR